MANNGTIDKNTNDDAELNFNKNSVTYVLSNEGSIDIGNISIGLDETVAFSGTSDITVDTLKITPLLLTAAVAEIPFVAATGGNAGITIWSENFESGYSDNDITAQDNNKPSVVDNVGITGADWTLSGQGDDYVKVNDSREISGTYSMNAKDIGENIDWITETMDVTGYTNITISLDYRDKDTDDDHDNGDKFKAYYTTDDGTGEVQFVNDNNDQNTVASVSVTIPDAGATTLSIRIRLKTDDGDSDERWYFDNVLVVATTPGTAGTAFVAAVDAVYETVGSGNLSRDNAAGDLLVNVIDPNSASLQITNNGTIDIGGNIINCDAGEVVITQGVNSEIKIAGTGTPFDTDITLNASADGNKIRYDGAGDQAIHDPVNNDYHDLNLENTGNKTTDFHLDIAGDLNIVNTAVLVPDANRNINIEGSWISYGTAGFTEGTTAYVQFDGTGVQGITSGSGTENFYDVKFTNTGSTTLNDHLDVARNIDIENTATLIPAVNQNINIGGSWSNHGTSGFTEGSSAYVEFDGTGAQSITNGDGTENFYDVKFTSTGTTTANDHLDVANNVDIENTATLAPAASQNINIAGNWTNHGTNGFTEGNSIVNFDGTGTQGITSGSNTENFYDVKFTNTATTTANDHLDVARNLDIENSAILAPAANQNINIAGNWTNYGTAGFTEGTTGYVDFDGGAQSITNNSGNGTENFNHVTFSNSGTKTTNCTLDVDGDLSISGDALLDVDVNDNNIKIAGNWNNTANVGFGFDGDGTNTTFNGSGPQSITCTNIGTETFNQLRINQTGGGTVTMINHVLVKTKVNFNGSNGYLLLNGNDLTINNYVAGDITGFDSNEFIIVDNTGSINLNGLIDLVIVSLPMGTQAASNNYALAEITLTSAGNGLFEAKMCEGVATDGGCGGGVTDHALNYTWNFTSNSLDAEVKLYWHSSAHLGTFATATSRVMHFSGGTWGKLNDGAPATDESGTIGAGFYSRSGTTDGFSPYAVQDGEEPLPIELLSFNATSQNNSVLIEWVTASEINNDFFTIERSDDGVNWDKIEVVSGAGNSLTQNNYTYTDENPLFGSAYYRLKQTDYDANFSFSDIDQVTNETTDSNSESLNVELFPNPVTRDQVFIKMQKGEYGKETLVILYDPSGREVYTKVIVQKDGETLTAIDLSGETTPDIYLVVGSSDNSLFRKKLIVK